MVIRRIAALALCAALLGGCGAKFVAVPEPGITGPPIGVHLSEIRGSYAAAVSAELRDRLIWSKALEPAGPEARLRLTARVQTELEDESGRDLVEVTVDTGRNRTFTVEDPFVGRKFKVYRPEKAETTRLIPYVHRRALVGIEYTLAGGEGSPRSGSVQARSEVKYGGVNQEAAGAPDLEDLPPAAETLSRLAGEAARRLAEEISPAGGRSEWLLAAGEGLGGDEELLRGVRLAEKGRWDEAEAHWRGLMEKGWALPEIYYNLGVAHERRGGPENLRTAREYYSRAARSGSAAEYRRALTRAAARLQALTSHGD